MADVGASAQEGRRTWTEFSSDPALLAAIGEEVVPSAEVETSFNHLLQYHLRVVSPVLFVVSFAAGLFKWMELPFWAALCVSLISLAAAAGFFVVWLFAKTDRLPVDHVQTITASLLLLMTAGCYLQFFFTIDSEQILGVSLTCLLAGCLLFSPRLLILVLLPGVVAMALPFVWPDPHEPNPLPKVLLLAAVMGGALFIQWFRIRNYTYIAQLRWNDRQLHDYLRSALDRLGREAEVRRQVEESLRERDRRSRQAQKMESLGTLAGGIAHDFNNLLLIIQGFTELAAVDACPPEIARKHLHEVLRACERASELVRRILTFSRQNDRKPEQLELGPIVRDSVELFRASTPARISVELVRCDDGCVVRADVVEMRQVLLNLCVNASHAVEATGGRIDVELAKIQTQEPIPGLPHPAPAGSYARLRVRDTGVGIPSECIDRIFEPFFTTKPVGQGTGMGLSMIHGVVAECHGTIDVQSTVGLGTTIDVYLPLDSKVAPTRTPVSIPAAKGSVRKARILIVDDEPQIATLLSAMVKQLDGAPTTAFTSTEALQLVRNASRPFELVLTDLTMPVMSGQQLAEKIALVDSRIPVVLISGYADRLEPHETPSSNIKKVLAKPIQMRELAQCLMEVLQAGSHPAATSPVPLN